MVMDSRSRRPLQRAMGGGGVSVIEMDRFARVLINDPDVHDDDGAEGRLGSRTSSRQVFVSKFAERVPVSAEIVLLNLGSYTGVTGITGSIAGWQLATSTGKNRGLASIALTVTVYSIDEDYDHTTLTWNILQGLARTQIGVHLASCDAMDEGNIGVSNNFLVAAHPGQGPDPADFLHFFSPGATVAGAYGIYAVNTATGNPFVLGPFGWETEDGSVSYV